VPQNTTCYVPMNIKSSLRSDCQSKRLGFLLSLFIGYKITDSSLPLKDGLLRQIATQTDKVPPFLKASVFTLFFAEN